MKSVTYLLQTQLRMIECFYFLLQEVSLKFVCSTSTYRPNARSMSQTEEKNTDNNQDTPMLRQITRINHIGIRVSSLDNARSFYEKLGFKFIVGPVGPEPIAVMEHPNGINLNLILNAQKGDPPSNILMDIKEKHAGHTHFALEVLDAKIIENELNKNNIKITGGPLQFPTGTSIFVRDPDRNVVEFHQPKKDFDFCDLVKFPKDKNEHENEN